MCRSRLQRDYLVRRVENPPYLFCCPQVLRPGGVTAPGEARGAGSFMKA